MKKPLFLLAIVFILAGGFVVGIALRLVMDEINAKKEYWLGKGEITYTSAVDPELKDRWNKLLVENRKNMTIASEMYGDARTGVCEMRISNATGSQLACTVTLIRDATGELMYQSKLIDPGYYIENAKLAVDFRAGYYPATAVWTFYQVGGDDIIGEMANKVVVILEE
ncbi:MAG: hypothetical protein LBR77_00635 [Lachnospiraceae bacterium]|jgi:hypothetical protein|nr:hypothetical protein [Lachnospiraceae bacterium]